MSLKTALALYDASIRDIDDRRFYGRSALETTLNASPVLKANVELALEKGYLRAFTYDSAKLDGAGGSYDSRTGKIDITEGSYNNTAALVFVLGHETQHALSLKGQEQPYAAKLKDGIDAVLAPYVDPGRGHSVPRSSPASNPRDYTAVAREYVEGVRAEEAQAHIGGFNAVVSLATTRNQGAPPDLRQLYETLPERMGDFIERRGQGADASYRMKQGLTLAQDGTLAFSPGNIDAMKIHYADKFPGSFGENGLLDYRHQSLTTVWKAVQNEESRVVRQESAEHYRDLMRANRELGAQGTAALNYPPVDNAYRIDFAALGANPAVLRFPPDGVVRMVDTDQKLTVMDEQRVPRNDPRRDAVLASEDPTETAVRGRDDARRLLRDQGLLRGTPGEALSDAMYKAGKLFGKGNPDDPSPNAARAPAQAPQAVVVEPALLVQARAGLEQIGGAGGLGDRLKFENAAAALALQAHRDGFAQIDQVMRNIHGDKLIAVQGQDPSAPQSRHAVVDLAAATQQPARDSVQQLQQAIAQGPQQPAQGQQAKLLTM